MCGKFDFYMNTLGNEKALTECRLSRLQCTYTELGRHLVNNSKVLKFSVTKRKKIPDPNQVRSHSKCDWQ